MPKAPNRLSVSLRRWAESVFALLWLSGVLWLGFHYFLRVEGEFGPQAHVLEGWWLRLHGLAAFAGLVVCGILWPAHIQRAWPSGRNRASGLLLIGLLAWLAVTGYALYYFGNPETRPWLPWLHWVVGLSLVVIIPWHLAAGWKRKPE